MPMSTDFQNRLSPNLKDIVDHFGTPFHIYDEIGIRETGRRLTEAFKTHAPFREYFAVKALPNLRILKIMQDMSFGFDCSSIPELVLSRMAGGQGEDIMFTSNNTTQEEFASARAEGGSIINLDDISLVDKLADPFPELISFRYNPGPRRTGNTIIGNPAESKYGVSHDQIVSAYQAALQRGAHRFGLHTMIASNELDYRNIVETTRMILDIAARVGRRTGIQFEFVNIGGGIGIPYQPDQTAFNLNALAADVENLFQTFQSVNGYRPGLAMECGRFMTGAPRGACHTGHQPQIHLPGIRGGRRLHVGPHAPRYVRRLPSYHRPRAQPCHPRPGGGRRGAPSARTTTNLPSRERCPRSGKTIC